MERVEVTVVGGGPVGLFASFYAGLRGMSVRIIDSLPELGGQLMALYPEKHVFDVAGFPSILAKDLAQGFIEQGTRFGPDVVLGEVASSIEREGDGWIVHGGSGEAYPSQFIIVSAGAGAFSPTKIGCPNEEAYLGHGLSYGVRRLDEFVGRDVLVVGGGDSALDWAVHLHPVARRVRIVHRRDEFRAHEETVAEAKRLGVEFLVWRTVEAIQGDGRITGVTLLDGQSKLTEETDCDAIVVNIGYKSTLGPLKGWGMVIEKNQILVDHLQQTNLPGIFAVGDVCTRDGKIKLIATGAGEAATAVCVAKTLLDPAAKLFPGHSSDLDLG